MVGSRGISGIQVEMMLIAIWIFMAGIEERGPGIVKDGLGLGPCAEGKIPEMRPRAHQHLEVREAGRGGWRDCERELRIPVRFLRSG